MNKFARLGRGLLPRKFFRRSSKVVDILPYPPASGHASVFFHRMARYGTDEARTDTDSRFTTFYLASLVLYKSSRLPHVKSLGYAEI